MRFEEGRIWKIYIEEPIGEKEVVLQEGDIVKLECIYGDDESSTRYITGKFIHISVESFIKDGGYYMLLDTSEKYNSKSHKVYVESIKDVIKIEEE